MTFFAFTFLNVKGANYSNNYHSAHSIQETIMDNLNSLKIYPNPLTHKSALILRFKNTIDATLNIYDLTGNLILTDSITNDSTKLVDVFSFNNGIYLLQIETDIATITRKIVIKR